MRNLLFFVVLIACTAEANLALSGEPIQPIPENAPLDPKKVELGRELFFEKKFSRDNTISCASCHDISTNGADAHPVARGIGGLKGSRNTPTVFNSSLNFRQFWDGRASNLEDQITGPLEHPSEMASNWPDVVRKLKESADYRLKFQSIYGKPPSKENITDAIATFERTLLTPNSRFDKFLRGETHVLSDIEKAGYDKFKRFGCVACHQGVNVGGNMFQTMGVMGNFFADRKVASPDLGRFTITKREKDRHVFRVPSLRNVSRTAPYFHDGSEPTLAGAVRTMGRYQLGRELSTSDITEIVQFLKTLDGELPAHVRVPASDPHSRGTK